MFKRHIIFLVTIAVVLTSADFLSAKAGSSGGSRSSGRSSYGNSSSTSKTSSAPASKYGNSATMPSSLSNQSDTPKKKYGNSAATPASGSPPASKYGNSAGTASAGGQSTKPSTYDQKLNTSVSKQQAKDSLAKYEAQQGQFKSKDTTTNYSGYRSNPIVNRSSGYDGNTYAYRRDNFYTTYNYQPPHYAYMGAPSFGMWDAMFLWFMLDHASDRNYSRMYYNHQNDPDIQRWRQETEKLSGENAELKAKLAGLDKEVAELKGQPIDPSYVPQGVDADIALNKKVLDSASPAAKKESHFFRWLLIFVIAALIFYYIYNKRKSSGSSAKFRLD
ncbi:MAG: hypothetical protein HQK97_06695 [Nitrospirae bacterium]|nr:hypothetical protein [Nitrospirota bacterium]